MESFFNNLQNMDISILQNVINTVIEDNDTELQNQEIDEVPTTIYGCEHYLRRCKIVSPCCQMVYPCRICHDEIEYVYQTDEKIKHKINRYDIKEVICTNCNKQQSVKQYCEDCDTCFGLYYCDICHLFDDIDKGQYHCYDCGFCRIKKDNFKHCKNCDMCVNTKEHKCIVLKESLCPICMTDMFTSTTSITQMLCGHYIHMKCYYELLNATYKCPICSISIVNTDEINKMIDLEVQSMTMPPEYKDIKVKILCNDCHKESNVAFHIAALKCEHCQGYNTRKI